MLRLKHVHALLELLSMVDGDLAEWLGLNPAELDALQEVFDVSAEHWLEVYGEEHPAVLEADMQNGGPLYVEEDEEEPTWEVPANAGVRR